MNQYWWRSNGESGQSGYAHGLSEEDVKTKVEAKLKEDITVFTMPKRPKSKRYTGELYSQ